MSRRRIALVSSNLLRLAGAIVVGSSIAAATPPRQPAEPPAATATVRPMPTVTVGQSHPHQHATPTHHHVPDDPTPQPVPATPERAPVDATPGPRPPMPPHSGEGILQPVTTPDSQPSPYAQNVPEGHVVHIAVPAVGIDTPVVEVTPVSVRIGEQTIFDWPVADWAAGHHSTSANPGDGGNIVIAGHDDVRGEVFRGLHDVEVGDEVIVTTEVASYTYVVQEIHFRKFKNTPLEEQLSIGGFINPMPEERLTLVTCWPYRVDTHRLIVVAKPAW